MLIPTVYIMLDGFRYDYLEHAPFMKELSGSSYLSRIEEPFGFQSPRPAVFAGVSPEVSDICNMFVFSPETSPFKKVRNIKIVAKTEFLNNLYRLLIAGLIRKTSRHTVLRETATTEKVPFELLPYFDYSEKKIQYEENFISSLTMFDRLREFNRNCLYLGYARKKSNFELIKRLVYQKFFKDFFESDETLFRIFKREIKKGDYDFIHLHFSITDLIGHFYGPYSGEIKEAIKRLDKQIKDVWYTLRQNYKDINLVISSDHGMVEVISRVDIWNRLKELPFVLGRDYMVFLDSTMARFWFKETKAKQAIIDLLQGFSNGKILAEVDYERLRIRFKHNKYWDIIWLADPGTLIFPNFFQWYGDVVKGIHGCEPSYPDNQGILLINTDRNRSLINKEVVSLIDLFPTMLDFLGLPVPQSCEGISLLKN